MSFLNLTPEVLGLVVGVVGGFVSGAVAAVLPGKVKLKLFLDGRLLSSDSPDVEFAGKIKELKYPLTFVAVQAVLLVLTLYGVWYFTMRASVLQMYLFILNLIFTLAAFGGGTMLGLMNKVVADAELSKEAYKAFMRKAVVASRVPSQLK